MVRLILMILWYMYIVPNEVLCIIFIQRFSRSVKLNVYTSRVARSLGKIRENLFFQGQGQVRELD